MAIKLVEQDATIIKIITTVDKKVLSSFPIISFGLVSKLSTSIKFLDRTISDPKTINTANTENNIKFIIKLKLPFINWLLFLTYLEKSPKFKIIIEKKVNNVPVTVINGSILFLEKKFLKFKLNLAEFNISSKCSVISNKNIINPK